MDKKNSRSHGSINLKFRLATETDLGNIQSLTNWAIVHTTANLDIHPNTSEQIQAWWNHHGPEHPVWIMEADGKFAGWASLSPFSPKIGYQRMVENSIYVAPNFHGNGFGSNCLDWLIQEAERLGYQQIIAKITAENEVSIRLHLRKGFVETGRLLEAAEKFDKILDVVILQKKLGEA
jgi:phosphinothricin acetyltransferase